MTEIEIYKQILQKQDEYIEYLKRYLTAFDLVSILNIVFEKELALLRQQLEKLDQCKNIIAKVKEANTPDKRSFEQAEAETHKSQDYQDGYNAALEKFGLD